MLSEEEKQEIINAAVEKALLLLPETVGHLMASQAVINKLNSKFYSDYPEFKDKKNIVAGIVEMVEGENPLDKYEDILKKSVPRIRERVNTLKSLDLKNVSPSPNLDFKGFGSGEI